MKGPNAFRTISEVAEDLDLPQHVLRFWETRFTQIKPMKRGGGRRYYRPEDVDLLRGIRLLLYAEGFTIRGVQRLLKEKGQTFVLTVGQTGTVETRIAAEADEEPARSKKAKAGPSETTAGTAGETGLSGNATDGTTEAATTLPEPPTKVAAEQPGRQPIPPCKPDAARPDSRRIRMALEELQEARRLLDSAF